MAGSGDTVDSRVICHWRERARIRPGDADSSSHGRLPIVLAAHDPCTSLAATACIVEGSCMRRASLQTDLQ